jgi:formylglycine-generating enzyme required for sulfatase activity
VILFSVIGLLILGAGGYFIINNILKPGPEPTPLPGETESPQIPNTAISPLPSEAPSLPSSARMANIPAGTYNVGKDPEGTNQSATQAIALDEFWIDQYTVTNLEFQQYMAEWTIPPGK